MMEVPSLPMKSLSDSDEDICSCWLNKRDAWCFRQYPPVMHRRCEACVTVGGRYFEQLMRICSIGLI